MKGERAVGVGSNYVFIYEIFLPFSGSQYVFSLINARLKNNLHSVVTEQCCEKKCYFYCFKSFAVRLSNNICNSNNYTDLLRKRASFPNQKNADVFSQSIHIIGKFSK